MTFRFVLALCASFCLPHAAFAQAAAPADPIAAGYAQQIIGTIMPSDRREDMMIGMMRTIMSQMREGILTRFPDEGIRQIIDAHLAKVPEQLRPVLASHMPRLIDAMAGAYIREFPRDELRQISDFSKTPAGQHYLSRSSALMGDPAVAAANQGLFAEAQRVTQTSDNELRKAITDYLSKHPDVARKIAQQQKAGGTQP